MSSLAGALDPIDGHTSNSHDIQFDESFDDQEANSVSRVPSVKDDEPQDEEMQDLFGEDQEVEFAKRDECVLHL